MLENKIRTQEEISTYLRELKKWMAEEDAPAEEMAAFFTKRLDTYEDVHLGNWGELYAHIADFFDGGLDLLLDIGCGTGLELESIYRRFPAAKVTGIDLSSHMLAKAREKFQNRAFRAIEADYFTYPLPAGAFDAALSFETLHHFPYERKGEIYKKLFHTLKNGGYYIECDYVACCQEEEDLCRERCRRARAKGSLPENVWIHIDTPLTMEHQLELMRNAGFQNARVLHQNCGTVLFRAEKYI
ncbi:MAG: methyltransferase domain-containing protein [Oscillospiraceae bacterium]|nr:methyltransferase domain-containing protein [Oscillospiraceae bacterium]